MRVRVRLVRMCTPHITSFERWSVVRGVMVNHLYNPSGLRSLRRGGCFTISSRSSCGTSYRITTRCCGTSSSPLCSPNITNVSPTWTTLIYHSPTLQCSEQLSLLRTSRPALTTTKNLTRHVPTPNAVTSGLECISVSLTFITTGQHHYHNANS